ncbi:MAG: ammonium transporter, partial [Alphaproteobacteria bacterium]|nr:ammonium transporter [Alphaproteobacteria bacterium]
TGAIAERVNFSSWIIILALWSLIVYIPVAHWEWGPEGLLATLGAIDFAGGLVVHITSGFSALVAALMYGKRINAGEMKPHDVSMILLGAALLWFGWFGFNAGSAIVSGSLSAHAFITTFIGASVAFVTWMIVDWIASGKPTATGSAIGIVVGLVCITPAAGYVTIKSAMLMCFVAGVLCNISSRYLKRITKLDDTLDVFACHGLGGVIGSILTGVFANKLVNSSIVDEGILVSGDSKLFIANLIAVVVVALYSVLATYIIIKSVNFFIKVRVSKDAEKEGLDPSLHGEAKHSKE